MEKIMYLRKSQKDNVDPNETIEQTLERHEHQLQEYALKEFGHYIAPENIYREVISGGEDVEERIEFLKVLKRIENKEVSHCLFLDTARISRTGIYGAGDIINVFYYTNTLICTPTKIYDLSIEHDKEFLEMELLQSANFLKYVKKVLMRGRSHSVENLGLFVGSSAPYGYDRVKLDKGYTLEANKDAETVKMIFNMRLNFVGTSTIANHLNELNIKPSQKNEWTREMVRNILNNITYAGMLTWGKRKTVKEIRNGKVVKTRPHNKDCKIVNGLHTGIITLEEFYKVQQIMKSHPSSKIPKHREIKNPLAGLVKCTCNRSMIRKVYSNKRREDLTCILKSCTNVSHLLEEVEADVIKRLNDYLKDFTYYLDNYEGEVQKVIIGNTKTINNIDKEIKKLKVRLESIMEAYELKDYTREQFLKRKKEVEDKIKELSNRKAELEINKEEDKVIRYKKAIPKLSLCINTYDNLSIANKNKLLKTIIKEIKYTKTEKTTKNNKAKFHLEIHLNI